MATAQAPARRGGCLKWVLIGLVAAALIGGATFAVVLYSFANSEVVAESMARAGKSAALTTKLDTSLKRGWVMTGSLRISGPSGSADLAVPVSGPKGGATLYVTATKVAGQWTYNRMQAAPDDGSSLIDLLKP